MHLVVFLFIPTVEVEVGVAKGHGQQLWLKPALTTIAPTPTSSSARSVQRKRGSRAVLRDGSAAAQTSPVSAAKRAAVLWARVCVATAVPAELAVAVAAAAVGVSSACDCVLCICMWGTEEEEEEEEECTPNSSGRAGRRLVLSQRSLGVVCGIALLVAVVAVVVSPLSMSISWSVSLASGARINASKLRSSSK